MIRVDPANVWRTLSSSRNPFRTVDRFGNEQYTAKVWIDTLLSLPLLRFLDLF
jgi:hypothetical protein